MIYLTYADQPSGVFSSQVVDVCRYMNTLPDAKIRLVAFISLHQYNKNKARIKTDDPNAWVLPMLPRMTAFGFNRFILLIVLLLTGERTIIARNVLACKMAIQLKKILKLKVCFDGRGAIAAEWNEYNVVPFPEWKQLIHQWEKQCVVDSDWRIAVSSELVRYWNERYDFTSSDFSVIPCTLNTGFEAMTLDEKNIASAREQMGFGEQDIVLVYSGSTAGWQSFDMLHDFLKRILNEQLHVKVLFLSEKDKNVDALKKEFPNRIFQKFVKHHEVTSVLTSCDYGILLREKSVTNRVASPTKFAEYLSAGLPVLISEEIGDYTAFVETNHCGKVLNSTETIKLNRQSPAERNRCITLVTENYTKDSQRQKYLQLKQVMN